MTVTSRDSRYSERVVWSPRGSGFFGGSWISGSWMAGCCVAVSSIFLSASCFHPFQVLESGAGGALLGFLLGAALRGGQALAVGPHFNSKRLLVVGAAFSREPVLRGWASTALQEFLQGGFFVAVSNAVATFDQHVLEKRPAQHFAGRGKPRIQVKCRDYGFKSVCEKRRLLAARGLLLAATQPKMLTEVQSSGGTLECLGVHHASSALGQLALRPIGEGRKQVFAGKQIENRVAQKLEAFVVFQRFLDSAVVLRHAELGNCGAVRQSALEQRWVPELVIQALLQLFITVRHGIEETLPLVSGPEA